MANLVKKQKVIEKKLKLALEEKKKIKQQTINNLTNFLSKDQLVTQKSELITNDLEKCVRKTLSKEKVVLKADKEPRKKASEIVSHTAFSFPSIERNQKGNLELDFCRDRVKSIKEVDKILSPYKKQNLRLVDVESKALDLGIDTKKITEDFYQKEKTLKKEELIKKQENSKKAKAKIKNILMEQAKNR